MDTFLIVIELLVVIGAIVMGVRVGGMGLGIFGAAGAFVLVFIFDLPPGPVPGGAITIILSVVTAAATMQAAGGIDYLVTVAAKLIRRSPRMITLVAPLVSYLFVVGSGTSNIFYPLIPVIYGVSAAEGIRPERPLSLSNIAAALGITSSPVAAAMVGMLVLVEPHGVTLPQALLVTIPSSLAALVVASLVMMRFGRELENDPVYRQRLAEGKIEPPQDAGERPAGAANLPRTAKISAYIFVLGVLFVLLFALVPGLAPEFTTGQNGSSGKLGEAEAIQLTMFTVALLILLVCKVKVQNIIKQPTFSSGVVAMVALFGVAWLANTFIGAHIDTIVAAFGDAVKVIPALFAVAVFIVAGLTTSQSATTNTIVPIGLALSALGVGPIVAMWQALAGVYMLPANGTQLACVATDLTGSTRISKFFIYHSFTVPLLICTAVAVAVGLAIAQIVF